VPRITVATPSYNQGAYLEATIRSILLQGYPNLQYIVVDGESTDQTPEILNQYADQISVIIREPDEGQSDAICKALAIADGDFFNWINSDDLLMPDVLFELADHFGPESDLYTFTVTVFGDAVASYPMRNQNLSARSILRDDRYSFSQPGWWFRTEQLRACGGIDKRFQFGFDWELLVRYLAAFPRVEYSSTVGAGFRLHDRSKTVTELSKQDEQANRFRKEECLIRDKLEAHLAPGLARASRLGRQRKPWHRYLVEQLDNLDQSPAAASARILALAIRHPRARLSVRTLRTVASLLSRYVRRRSSIGRRESR
jgi:glycosyltransferase involved in cell wall biosynthesis